MTATLIAAGVTVASVASLGWRVGAHPDQVQTYLAGAVLADTGVERLIAEARLVSTAKVLARARRSAGRRILGLRLRLPRGSTPLLLRAVRYVALSRSASPAHVAFCERMLLDCPAGARGALGIILSDLDLREALCALDVPTVVIVGEQDRLTPPVHARAIAEVVADAVLVEIPEVGHMTPVEAHCEVSRHIRDLVGRVLVPGTTQPGDTGQDERTAR